VQTFDVAFYTPDVLLTRLQRQPVGTVALAIDGHTNQATGHGTRVVFLGRHVGGMGTTIAHGYPKALGRSNGDIGAHRARLLEQGQGTEGLLKRSRSPWPRAAFR
jgi:hypothetical protein